MASRPWPVPGEPWLMTQSWHDLLFAHWPVPLEHMRAVVPAVLPIDTFDGHAWVGVVPFHMTNVAPRGVPSIPFVSAFPELNVRTYVTLQGKPGVYFFSLDAGSAVAVAAARTLFGLPYYTATMAVKVEGDRIEYSSRRDGSDTPPAELVASYGPTGVAQETRRGTLEYFLAERYCLYTVDGKQRVSRLEIDHAPWRLQPADAEIAANTMAAAAGIMLPAAAPLLHFVKRQDTIAWWPQRL